MRLLIVNQILPVSTLENVLSTVWEICILIVGCKGLTKDGVRPFRASQKKILEQFYDKRLSNSTHNFVKTHARVSSFQCDLFLCSNEPLLFFWFLWCGA